MVVGRKNFFSNTMDNGKKIKEKEMKSQRNIGTVIAKPCKEIKPSKEDYKEFTKELAGLINKHSLENGSNTPDFILAEYLTECLKSFNKTSRRREKWYGKNLQI
jgi:hypothetical protein